MSVIDFSPEDRRRWKLFNGKQPDPTTAFKTAGVPYFRRGKNRVLGPDDFMPVGPHAGKQLRAVPVDYLHWVNSQPWASTWAPWAAVSDYLSRHVVDASDAMPSFSDMPPLIWIQCMTLTTPDPRYIDHLHTFASAVLNFHPIQDYARPSKHAPAGYYPLTPKGIDHAARNGALILVVTADPSGPQPYPDARAHRSDPADAIRAVQTEHVAGEESAHRR